MKIAKITIAILGILALSFGVFYFFRLDAKSLAPTLPPPNTFTEEVKNKIENLNKSPISCFCLKHYLTVINDLEVYTDEGKIDTAQKTSLLKTLDYTYTPLFINQAYYIFKGSTWEERKLDTIRREVNRLMASKYIENTTSLKLIKDILDKLDEIKDFIAKARAFAADAHVNSINQQFDLDNTKDFIAKAAGYHRLKHWVNNNKLLQERLENIPMNMYNKHLNYLTNKVSYCTGTFRTMPSYNEYYNTIYQPIHVEFKTLEDNYSTYSVSYEKPEEDLRPLREQLKKDRISANTFYNNY